MPYTDLYTPDEFALIAGVRACYQRTAKKESGGNCESHQPRTNARGRRDGVPIGRYEIGFSNTDADLRTARFAYALKVLETAYARTLEEYPNWLQHEWAASEPGWRQLVFKSPQRCEAEERCGQLVQEIADGGHVTVDEGLWVTKRDGRDRMLMIRDIAEFDKPSVDAVVKGRKLCLTRTRLRFDYREIAAHIVALDERMLSLLNADEGRPPLTAADRELLDAAGRFEVGSMEAALDAGADIHAVDEMGESALFQVIQASTWDWSTPDADNDQKCRETAVYSSVNRLATVRWLVERGADVNLFGFEGLAPLSAAVLRHDPQLVRYLLSLGAQPASDQFPEDGTGEPTACYYASGDLHIVERRSQEEADLWEINVLLDAALLQQRLSQGISLRDAITPIGLCQPWVDKCSAAYLTALMWNRLDADLIEPFLAEQAVYESQHVWSSLEGKPAIMEYLRGKMSTLRQAGSATTTYAEIGVDSNGPCVVIAQGHPEKLAATLLIQVSEGLIKRIDVCGICPVPVDVRMTGIVPR